MLVMSGSFHDRDVALRYAGETLDALRRYAGVELASRLYAKIGRVAALAVGQIAAWTRWLFSPRRRRGPKPHEALREFFTTSGVVVAVHATSYHRATVEALVESLEPVAIFPTKVPYALYLFSRALLALIRGQLPEIYEITDRILWILENDRTTPVPDVQRKTALAGARHLRALAAVSRLEPSLDAELDEISKIGIRYFDLAAIHVRILKHHYRGETHQVAELEARAEPLALAIGSTWQLDGLIPIAAGYGHALMRNVVGLRRCVEDLERMTAQGYGVMPFLHMVRGEYLRERGQLDEAIASFEAGLGETPAVEQVVLSGLAETLLAKGDLERARAHAERSLELAQTADYGSVFVRVRTRSTLASIHAIEGDFEAARRTADAALDDARATDVPLLRGVAHETRARIAILGGDRAVFEAHRVECDRIFRETENPLLVARAERLPDLAAGAIDVRAATHAGELDVTQTGGTLLDRQARSHVVTLDLVASAVRFATGRTGLLSACRGPVERATLALEIAVEATRASRGFLFLADGGNLELAAPRYGAEPPHGVVAELERSLERQDQGEEVTGAAFDGWRRIVLRSSRGVAVGALALLDAVAPGPGDAHLFSLLAEELAAANELGRSVPPSQG
jgi:tetratricopeptide (TPR) repeat protein